MAAGGRPTGTLKGYSFQVRVDVCHCLLVIAIGVALAVAYHQDNNGRSSHRYAVIFDAGSTATRVHIYRFRARPLGAWKLELIDEYFEELAPGLASLAGAKEAEMQTETLIENAFAHFPDARWDGRVPYVYRATAGLRAMSNKTRARELLSGVERVIKRYANDQHSSVAVLDGEEEGVHAWVTLAYLLWADRWPPAMTIVDLGGISTQITGAGRRPASHKRLAFSPVGPAEEVSLASLSLHGLGLASVRRRLVHAANRTCACMKKSWMPARYHHHGDWLEVHGHNDADNEHVCRQRIHDLINRTASDNIPAYHGKIYLFSYFFDAALGAKLVKSEKGGPLRVRDFDSEARKWCGGDGVEKQFLCLDLVYAHAVLNHLLKLSNDQRVEVVKKIRGIEVSWTLGLVLSVL